VERVGAYIKGALNEGVDETSAHADHFAYTLSGGCLPYGGLVSNADALSRYSISAIVLVGGRGERQTRQKKLKGRNCTR
jgi:hypothetical protein